MTQNEEAHVLALLQQCRTLLTALGNVLRLAKIPEASAAAASGAASIDSVLNRLAARAPEARPQP